MRKVLLAATLVLAVCLPNAVRAESAPGTAPVDAVKAAPLSAAMLESVGITPCHLNFVSSDGVSLPGFGMPSLVPNGGRCTSDLSCASKCCTNGICVPHP